MISGYTHNSLRRDPGSPSQNGFMEPKYLAIRFGDYASHGSLGIDQGIVGCTPIPINTPSMGNPELFEPYNTWVFMGYNP